MHPMDMNWYFDHDDLDALRQRALRKQLVEPFASDSRWLSLNEELFKRAINCQDYKVSFYNIRLKDAIGTPIPSDNPVMSNESFAYFNSSNVVETNEIFYHVHPNSYDWSNMIGNQLEAFLYCFVTIDTTGAMLYRTYSIELVLSLENIQSMGKETFTSFIDSFY